jgi:tetratricopeptide (TPR) repeat protein
MLRPRIIALLLALVTFIVYLPTAHFEFTNYDDNDYVTANPNVQSGLTLAGVMWAFTTGHAGNWHPVTWLSHMTDVTLFGMNPGAHHFVNALFHAANAALLFVLLFRLTKRLWPCALLAALFAWHPLRVESVAWVAERKDVLSTFFALLTLLSYAKFVELSQAQSPKSKVWFAGSLLAFALGLMAKPMLVTLPCVLLLLDFWPLQRFSLTTLRFPLLLEKLPFFALTAASCFITFIVQHSGHAVATLQQIPILYRLENAPVAAARYLLKMFCPINLAVVYPLNHIPLPELLAALALLFLISALAWRWRNERPFFLMGWLWFAGTLVPVIGLIQVGSASMADRYTYLPGIGILVAVIFTLAAIVEKNAFLKLLSPALAALVLLVCVSLTEMQLQHWRNSETLFRHAVAVTVNNDVAHIDLGTALDSAGRSDEALLEYRAAARINPDRPQVHFNLGLLYRVAAKHTEALAEFRTAISLDVRNAAAHSAAGGELAALGKYDEALKEFAEAERLAPRYAMPRLETAKVFFLQGRDPEAVDELRAALRAEPDNFEILSATAHYLAANENASARDGRNALILAIKANELSGRNQPQIFDIMGMALAENGDFTNAVSCAQNALALAGAAKLKKLEPLQQRLELYQQGQPWRESFRATNAPLKN